ncbi:transcription factor RF2a [Lolium perenne]|uniref:transcription factor RF2a n=1 Tax=Lolium perenne TaxID=4522 RepID=UPI0021EA848F|nr:transcription factor RF2a-like [Lolium perenne]
MDRPPVQSGGGGGGGCNVLPPKPSLSLWPPTEEPPESDISHMPDSPARSLGHRRAHSEIIGLPDDLDLGVPGACGDGPSLSDENEEELFSMFLDTEKFNAQLREASETGSSCASAGPRPRHHHSHSMDASSSFDAEQLLGTPATEGMSTVDAKKAMSNSKLAELALVDPKKAKRIWANRQSAARSKERKMRYISELERKVQTLHAEATTLSTQLALLHRDTAGLSTENSELKMRLQNVEQQVHLQDALNDALKSELQRLKMATGQMGSNVGGMNFMGPPPPHSFGGNQPIFHIQGQAAMQPMHQMQMRPHHPQPLLHPLQLQAQQLQLQQQAAAGAAQPPNLKMKRTISAPNQWVGGWSESSGN